MRISYKPVTETPAELYATTEWFWGDKCSFRGQNHSHGEVAKVWGQHPRLPAVHRYPLSSPSIVKGLPEVCWMHGFHNKDDTLSLPSEYSVHGTNFWSMGQTQMGSVLPEKCPLQGKPVPLSTSYFLAAGIGIDGCSWSTHPRPWSPLDNKSHRHDRPNTKGHVMPYSSGQEISRRYRYLFLTTHYNPTQ